MAGLTTTELHEIAHLRTATRGAKTGMRRRRERSKGRKEKSPRTLYWYGVAEKIQLGREERRKLNEVPPVHRIVHYDSSGEPYAGLAICHAEIPDDIFYQDDILRDSYRWLRRWREEEGVPYVWEN